MSSSANTASLHMAVFISEQRFGSFTSAMPHFRQKFSSSVYSRLHVGQIFFTVDIIFSLPSCGQEAEGLSTFPRRNVKKARASLGEGVHLHGTQSICGETFRKTAKALRRLSAGFLPTISFLL